MLMMSDKELLRVYYLSLDLTFWERDNADVSISKTQLCIKN